MAEGGYARTVMSAVCRRAGVRPPAIYHHYGSKDGLIASVVETVASAWLTELERASREGTTLDERVAAALRGWRALILDPQGPVLLLARIQLECADSEPRIRESLARVMERATDIIHRSLEETVGPFAGSVALAQTTVSLVQGAALRHHLTRDRDVLDRQLAEIGKTILTRIAARHRTNPSPLEKS